MEDDMIHTSTPIRRFLHGLCDHCRRGIPVGSHLKALHGQKYARKVRHPRLGGRIVLEKYYNEGAALNFMVKKPKLLRIIHTVILVVVGIFSYFLMRLNGHALEKTGVALLLGGGLNNLYDRYTKGHVVDYFHLNFGPKWLRAIVFNISDFCIFIGALLAVAGSEVS